MFGNILSYPAATQTFPKPLPPSSYNPLALRREYLPYPKLKESEPHLGVFSPSSNAATLTWTKTPPPEKYGGMKGNNKPYPVIKPFEIIMPSSSATQKEKKKYSYLEIIGALEQQLPTDQKIKDMKRDLIFLEIAKQTRELSSDEVKLEASIKKEIDDYVSKPIQAMPVEPSKIPPSGEQPPSSAVDITDDDRKMISELGIEDIPAEKLAQQIGKSDDIENLLSEWRTNIKKYSSLIDKKLDIKGIEQDAIIKVIEDEIDEGRKNPIYELDKETGKTLKREAMKAVRRAVDSDGLLNILYDVRKLKDEVLERIDKRKADEAEEKAKIEEELKQKINKLDEKENKIKEMLSETKNTKEKAKLYKDLDKVKQEKKKLETLTPPKKKKKKKVKKEEREKAEEREKEREKAKEQEEEKETVEGRQKEQLEKFILESQKAGKGGINQMRDIAKELNITIPDDVKKKDMKDYFTTEILKNKKLKHLRLPVFEEMSSRKGANNLNIQDLKVLASNSFDIKVPENIKSRKDVIRYIETQLTN